MKGALLGALIYLTAAAAGVILHAATVAGHTGIATATEQNQQNDDPAAVAAPTVITHKKYLHIGLKRCFDPLIPTYSRQDFLCKKLTLPVKCTIIS